MKILFICTGNTCRSPMAKIICEDLFKKEKINATVSSAGINVIESAKASEYSVLVCEQKGLDLTNHGSSQVTDENLQEVDLILTMTASHKEYLLKATNAPKEKVFTLRQYCGDTTNTDIQDPYGGDFEDYCDCFEQIELYIAMLAKKLKE